MRTTAAALICLSLAAWPAAVAHAADGKPDAAAREEASRRFKSGVSFYKTKDFSAALVEFKHAYELAPNYVVLYNLGQTARELKDYPAALDAFQRYLADGGAKIPPSRQREVNAALEDLKQKVGRIKIVTSEGGAQITVDDVAVGTSPLGSPVVANVGRHKLTATLSGYAPVQRVVDVASMEETTAKLDLVKLQAIEPRQGPPRPPPPKPGPGLLTWVALSGTGAFLVAASVTGGLAVSAHGSLKTALATFPGDPKAIADAQSKTRSLAVATDVLGALTLAGAGATTALFLLGPRAKETPAKTGAPAGTGIPPVGVTVWPGGLAVSGAF